MHTTLKPTFEIGDVVQFNNVYDWCDGATMGIDYRVVDQPTRARWKVDQDVNGYTREISVDCVNRYPYDFMLIAKAPPVVNNTITVTVTNDGSEPETELGKKIAEYIKSRYVPSGGLFHGKVGLANVVQGEQETVLPLKRGDDGFLRTSGEILDKSQFLIEPSKIGLTFGPAPEALGVYRPNLEDRKVGKVRVELVDDGFPLALREIARVMTWAQEAKGYKDHDWQNLPNAEVSLAAAASRHRTDHIEQRKVKGLPISDCVDHESKILHKAHEAFGVLAQLELMLRGKFE